MKNKPYLIIFLMPLLIALISCNLHKTNLPRNIILLIADGCGFNHIDASSYYQYGERGRQVYEVFPVRLAVSTYASGNGRYDPSEAWGTFEWVMRRATDSAAAATAIATGHKTRDGYLGVDTLGQALETILERAEKLKKSSGVVTSVPVNHATPAAFCVHDTSRDDYSGIMDYMLFKSQVDVIMGAGNFLYDNTGLPASDSLAVTAEKSMSWLKSHDKIPGADADGNGTPDAWTFIDAESTFQKYSSGATPSRVLGLARVRWTLQQGRDGDVKAEPYQQPLITTVPTLREIARAAINILDDDPDGFFLMIEGGAVDWAAHENETGRMIEEMIAFNQAVQGVVDWVNSNSNWNETLVIVTADHETGYLTGPGSGTNNSASSRITLSWTGPVNHGKGKLPGVQWNSDGHTNSLVPFYAKGCGSELFQKYADETDPIRGKYLDNTEIGKVMFELWKK